MRLGQHCYACRRTCYCWSLCWYCFIYLSCLSSRDCSKGNSWSRGQSSTMGHYLGHFDSILHSIWSLMGWRWAQQSQPTNFCFPHSMGCTDSPRSYPILWNVLPSKIPKMARLEGSMGRGNSSYGSSSRWWRYQPSQGSGRVSRNRRGSAIQA